jgi:hypothetical protein
VLHASIIVSMWAAMADFPSDVIFFEKKSGSQMIAAPTEIIVNRLGSLLIDS